MSAQGIKAAVAQLPLDDLDELLKQRKEMRQELRGQQTARDLAFNNNYNQ